MLIKRLLLLLALLLSASAHALTADEARAIAIGDTDARIEALNKAVAAADDKTAAFIQALADDAVKIAGDKVFVVRDDKAIDPVTGAERTLPDDAEDVINNNRMRGELDTALAALKLFSQGRRRVRAAAVADAAARSPTKSRLPLIEKAYAAETRCRASRSSWSWCAPPSLLGSSDKAKRLEAAQAAGAAAATRDTKRCCCERLTGRDRRRRQGRAAGLAAQHRGLAGLGRRARRGLLRHQPGLHPAAGGAGPGDHLRPDGRDQHGARRADDDRRLRHLRGAGPVPEIPARRLRLVPAGRGAGGLRAPRR